MSRVAHYMLLVLFLFSVSLFSESKEDCVDRCKELERKCKEKCAPSSPGPTGRRQLRKKVPEAECFDACESEGEGCTFDQCKGLN